MAENVNTAFQEIKTGSKYRWVTFHMGAGNKEIVVKETAEPSKTYQDLLQTLTAARGAAGMGSA